MEQRRASCTSCLLCLLLLGNLDSNGAYSPRSGQSLLLNVELHTLRCAPSASETHISVTAPLSHATSAGLKQAHSDCSSMPRSVWLQQHLDHRNELALHMRTKCGQMVLRSC